MSQTYELLNTLKKVLRAQGITYRRVAAELQLSEPSIKRMFASQHLSLGRLEQITRLAGLQLADLVQMMEANMRQLTELTERQEQELVSDTRLLLVAFLAVNAWSFDEIQDAYDFSEAELVQRLAHLDRLHILELLPGNRIKLLISPKFAWRSNGPIENFFRENMEGDFFRAPFSHSGESYKIISGMLSPESGKELVKKIEQLALETHHINRQDQALPLEQRFGFSMLLAIRRWHPQAFAQYQRKT